MLRVDRGGDRCGPARGPAGVGSCGWAGASVVVLVAALASAPLNRWAGATGWGLSWSVNVSGVHTSGLQTRRHDSCVFRVNVDLTGAVSGQRV